MPSVKIKINPSVLTWAINNSNADEFFVRASFPNIDEWLSGNKKPTFNQLENLSKKLHIPFGYLLLGVRQRFVRKTAIRQLLPL